MKFGLEQRATAALAAHIAGPPPSPPTPQYPDELRAGLHDGPAFTRELEAACRRMRRRWCRQVNRLWRCDRPRRPA